MEINKVLNNSGNIYYGHGTGTDSYEVSTSILNNGLRCSHGSLYYTSCLLGMGTQIEKAKSEMLKKWPHKNSNIIVIVSLPMKYKIIESYSLGTYNLGDAAFYYTPSKELREQYSLTESPYVSPEFILGYYDATNDSFTQNPKYYENLPKEAQEELFNQIKQNYFNIIHNGCGIEEYQEVLKDMGLDLPLSKEEISRFRRQIEEQNLLSSLSIELMDKPLKLPDGSNIPAMEYVKNIVLPRIPLNGRITLKNGSMISVTQFIVECVLYDCQERYNGDFSKYLQENVNLSALNKSINMEDVGTIKK